VLRVKSPFRMVLDAGYLGAQGTGLATCRRQWTAVARGWYGCLHHSAPNRQDAERPLAATGLRDHYPVHRPAGHRNVCGGAHDLLVDPLEEDEFARRHSRACLANSALPPITVGKSLRTLGRNRAVVRRERSDPTRRDARLYWAAGGSAASLGGPMPWNRATLRASKNELSLPVRP